MIKNLPALLAFSVFSSCLAAQKTPVYTTEDSVETIASSHYRSYSFFHNLLMGKNYRREWNLPVKLPVFYLSRSGFAVKELGGGMQTKSLHLVDGAGKEWSLRTVDKNVTEAMPPALQNTMAEKASQDLISAAFPYSAPIAGELATALGLPCARPQIFYVAEDSAFGGLNSIFANTVCSLEERDPGFSQTDNSETVVEKLEKDAHYKIQQPLLLKARLLDMLMADWDRHADNWRWGLKDSAGFHFYYPVPRDRDWAFYNSGGWLPKLMQFTGGLRHLVSFRKKLHNLKYLNWKEWTLDKTFLNELTAADWTTAIRELQVQLTDSCIEKAVKTMPAPVYRLDGEIFIAKLKTRRDDLHKEVMKYYRFLSANVSINGSDEEEHFIISSSVDGLQVTVYNSTKEKIYQRYFLPETKFITLNGKGGDDSFTLSEEMNSGIRIKISGGAGKDSYDIRGNGRIKIYDSPAVDNNIVNKGRARFYLE